LFVHILNRG